VEEFAASRGIPALPDQRGAYSPDTYATPIPQAAPVPAADAAKAQRTWRIRNATGRVVLFRELTSLQRWIVERRVSRDDEISDSGKNWKRLGEIEELSEFFKLLDASTGRSNSSNSSSKSSAGQVVAPPRSSLEQRVRQLEAELQAFREGHLQFVDRLRRTTKRHLVNLEHELRLAQLDSDDHQVAAIKKALEVAQSILVALPALEARDPTLPAGPAQGRLEAIGDSLKTMNERLAQAMDLEAKRSEEITRLRAKYTHSREQLSDSDERCERLKRRIRDMERQSHLAGGVEVASAFERYLATFEIPISHTLKPS
jgi:hypothetical protein